MKEEKRKGKYGGRERGCDDAGTRRGTPSTKGRGEFCLHRCSAARVYGNPVGAAVLHRFSEACAQPEVEAPSRRGKELRRGEPLARRRHEGNVPAALYRGQCRYPSAAPLTVILRIIPAPRRVEVLLIGVLQGVWGVNSGSV